MKRLKAKAITARFAQVASPAAAVGLTPSNRMAEALTASAAAAVSLVSQRLIDRQAAVITEAAGQLGSDPESFIAELLTSPEKEELLIHASESARRATLEAKRTAIANALARGAASDEAAVNETEFLRLLDALDVAHVRALQILSEPRAVASKAAILGQLYYLPEDLGEVDPALRGSGSRLLAALAAHGLVQQHGGIAAYEPLPDAWMLTTFGRETLRRFTAFPALAVGDPGNQSVT